MEFYALLRENPESKPLNRFHLVGAPVLFALRRIRERPLAIAVLTVALAGAGALIGWSSVAAALAHEENVRLRLNEMRPDERSVQAVYHLGAGEADRLSPDVTRFFEGIADVTDDAHRVELWHSLGDEIRFAVPDDLADVAVASGRLPAGPCRERVCEALALSGEFRVGEHLRLARGVTVRVVGRGSLRPEALPVESAALPRTPELTDRAVLVRSIDGSLQRLARDTGRSVVTTAALDPGVVHGSELRPLGARLRRELIRLERAKPLGEAVGPTIETTAPLARLDELADRGDVARERLLLVAGQAAALVIAFAGFAASARRRETRLLDEQLATLGASRVQIATARAVEAVLPGVLGTLVALVGVRIAAEVIEAKRGLPSSFVAAALPVETVVAIATVAGGAIALLYASLAPWRRSRFGIGALELAALVALGLVAWQTATTGALDPAQIEAGARPGPILLLLPALAFFVTGVLLLRALPLALRLAERSTRATPLPVRLAFLSAARSPAQAAAATTFLAVALGSALFGLNYRATLEQQARDEARFSAGARWRIVERAGREGTAQADARASKASDTRAFTGADVAPVTGPVDVAPLTRFARATAEEPTPVLRLDGRVREEGVEGEEARVQILALPAIRVPHVNGWRDDFSPLMPAEIARRLRPRPVRLKGPRIAPDATALRVWVRADTKLKRFLVLHLLLAEEQRFIHVRGGTLPARKWERLHVRVPRSLRGAELVGVEFPPLFVPVSTLPDLGSVRLGRFQQRTGRRWSSLPRLSDWSGTVGGGSVDAFEFVDGPVKRPIEFRVEGSPLALMRPSPPLPEALPGLASEPIAAAAVDRTVTLDVQGKEIPVRVAASARLFPTIVDHPVSFVVLDYETLFAALNLDQPGLALPSEAWFFEPETPRFLDRLREPPFRLEAAVGAEPLTARLLSDPLAAGARDVLGLAALAGATLGVLGLVLAARSALASERVLLAEYEALGVPPATLARSTQLRLFALSFLGLAAGVLGGLLAVRMVGAFVAVTGTATRPLPPIDPVAAWKAGGVVLASVALAAGTTAALLARQTLRETAARRLRA